jgi:hypothetical protein
VVKEADMAKDEPAKVAADDPKEASDADDTLAPAETERAYTDPADAEAAKRATVKVEPKRAGRGGDSLRGDDWAGRPRFVCPVCDHAVVAAADEPRELQEARDLMIDHIRGQHPERAPQVVAEA